MGQKLLRTAAITGIKEIGELAALSVTQALALFGKQGAILRSMALGIDNSPVDSRNGARRILQQADFMADTIDEPVIRGCIEALAGYAGLLMRRDKLGSGLLKLVVVYSDDMRAEGQEKPKRQLVLDRDIASTADRIYKRIVVRRIRVRSIGLSLEGLMPLGYEPDLFEPETDMKNRFLQEAVDTIQNRYGVGKITKGLALAASMHNSKQLLTAGQYEH